MAALGIPFDAARGIIPNDRAGRILGAAGERGGVHLPGLYCAGWVKRGPTGVIASTMVDAFATAEAIAGDWERGVGFLGGGDGGRRTGWEGVKGEVEERRLRRVSWRDWERIDRAERERGRKRGKEREKFVSVGEMLGVLD